MVPKRLKMNNFSAEYKNRINIIDEYMKKALAAHYPKDFDPKIFGENAGLAQQYIFYYARSGNV